MAEEWIGLLEIADGARIHPRKIEWVHCEHAERFSMPQRRCGCGRRFCDDGTDDATKTFPAFAIVHDHDHDICDGHDGLNGTLAIEGVDKAAMFNLSDGL